MTRRLLAASALLVSVGACGETRPRDGGPGDAGHDTASALDARADVALDADRHDAPDAVQDASGSDALADGWFDTGVDAGVDAGPGDAGWDAACPEPLHRCGDACVPWDDCNCEACGDVGPCTDGHFDPWRCEGRPGLQWCPPVCSPDGIVSPSYCSDLNDDNNCGECGHRCDREHGFVCHVVAPGPAYRCTCLWECGGLCVNPAMDPAHCGACDIACAPGEICVDAVCRLP